MEIVDRVALISINETLFIQLISFLIFLFIINRLMFRPLRKVMNERDEYMRNMETEIVEAEKDLDIITSQLKEKAASIKQEAFDMKEDLENSGSLQAAEIFDSTRKEILDMKDKNKKEIEAQISEARKHIQAESEIIAMNIMENILERRLA